MARDPDLAQGLAALRHALAQILEPDGALVPSSRGSRWLLSEAVDIHRPRRPSDAGDRQGNGQGNRQGDRQGDADRAASSEQDEAEATRLIALVELARGGDADAFGLLFDHYHVAVHRFVYYRVGSVAVAEDLTSETFFRALRSMGSFRWQGKDFGAWLTTIARNLTNDHFKASRTRLEHAVEDMSPHDGATEGPEDAVLAAITNETLLAALTALPHEQRECLIMRFLQGLTIAETAQVLGRSHGAVKQLQLRGVRGLAKLLPEGLR